MPSAVSPSKTSLANSDTAGTQVNAPARRS